MLAYDIDPPGMELEYSTPFNEVVKAIIREMSNEAYQIIEKYFSFTERESIHFVDKLCYCLRNDQEWAYDLCHEMDLTEQHIAALKDDVKQMKYLLIYKD